MNDWQEKVQKFQRDVMGTSTSPNEPQLRDAELRARLIVEEAIETAMALVGVEHLRRVVLSQLEGAFKHYEQSGGDGKPNLVDAIDGLCDEIYVCLGTAESIGIDLDPFFEEVHAANMRKRDPTRAQSASVTPVGKLIKPEGWRGPDIEGVLARVRARVSAVQVLRQDARVRARLPRHRGGVVGRWRARRR